MMDDRRSRLIAEVIKYLEDMDGQDLKSHMGAEGKDPMQDMGKDGVAVMVAGKGPAEGSPEEEKMESPEMEAHEAEMPVDDEELEELSKLSR